MIERFFLEQNLSFESVELEFSRGLIVFTGPSGSGKSVLFDSFLALFGFKDAKASICEAQICNGLFADENFGIEFGDDVFVKLLKKEKVRYLLNNQNISKNALNEFSKNFIRYLHLRDVTEFAPVNLLSRIDEIALANFAEFASILDEFHLKFSRYKQVLHELEKLKTDETKLEELKEFLEFEIKKIESIDPKIGEYDELIETKKQISKKDKIIKAIDNCYAFFELAPKVSQALGLIEEDNVSFDNAISDVSNIFEIQKAKMQDLSDDAIETILDRIEKLSSLNKRFGSIEEALEFLQTKKIELEKLHNITFEKLSLEKKLKEFENEFEQICPKISEFRKSAAKILQTETNKYLASLYLGDCVFTICAASLSQSGKDAANIEFGEKNFDKLSSGEFNRLRLSYLSALANLLNNRGGILFLDEIDANLSGKESFAIAKVLKSLSKTYQVFAISHQPQLTASADQHFLITKKDDKSYANELSFEERAVEISRMISLDEIGEDAKNYAIKLLQECQNG